jgi:hypothetical protein
VSVTSSSYSFSSADDDGTFDPEAFAEEDGVFLALVPWRGAVQAESSCMTHSLEPPEA